MTDPIEQLAKARAFVAEHLPQLVMELIYFNNNHAVPECSRLLELEQITATWAGHGSLIVAAHLVNEAALEAVAHK